MVARQAAGQLMVPAAVVVDEQVEREQHGRRGESDLKVRPSDSHRGRQGCADNTCLAVQGHQDLGHLQAHSQPAHDGSDP